MGKLASLAIQYHNQVVVRFARVSCPRLRFEGQLSSVRYIGFKIDFANIGTSRPTTLLDAASRRKRRHTRTHAHTQRHGRARAQNASTRTQTA